MEHRGLNNIKLSIQKYKLHCLNTSKKFFMLKLIMEHGGLNNH